MPADLTIRLGKPADAPALATLHRASILTLCASSYSAAQLEAWAGPKQAADYDLALEAGSILVAERTGEVAGFALLDLAAAELRALYVAPAHAHHGVGSCLLRAVEAAAREAGLRGLGLNATLNSVRFYERAGYVNRGQATNPLPGGLELPCVRFTVDLAPPGVAAR